MMGQEHNLSQKKEFLTRNINNNKHVYVLPFQNHCNHGKLC
jgi:hypothetical protein